MLSAVSKESKLNILSKEDIKKLLGLNKEKKEENKIDIKTAVVMRELGIRSCNSTSDINFLMNRMYLAQDFGMEIDYTFEWNETIPFSKKLLEDAKLILQDQYESVKNYTLNQASVPSIQRVTILSTNCPYDLSLKRWCGIMVCVSRFRHLGIESGKPMIKAVKSVNRNYEPAHVTVADNIYKILKKGTFTN